MDNINIVLYICIVIPFLLVLPVLDKKSRKTVFFIAVGLTVCLAASGINYLLHWFIEKDAYYFATTISPVVEEVLKAIPILIFAFTVSDDRKDLLAVSFSLGVGFAVLENAVIFTGSQENVRYAWAIARGFGASLMHSICTMCVGVGMSYVKKNRKIFYSEIFALLAAAITYHAIFNVFVLSQLMYLGILIPISTYLPLIWIYKKRRESFQS